MLDKQKKGIHNAQPRLNDSDVKQANKSEQIREESSFFLAEKRQENGENKKKFHKDLQKEKNFCIVRILVADKAMKKLFKNLKTNR